MTAFAHDDGKITIFDHTSRKVLAEVKCDVSVTSITFDQSGLQLATGHADGSIQIWDLRNIAGGQILLLVKNDAVHTQKNQEGIPCLLIHPSVPLLITCGADGNVKLFEMS